MIKKPIITMLTITLCCLMGTVVGANTLKSGSSGYEVRQLQDMLVTQGYLIDNVDGVFGNNMRSESFRRSVICL